MFIRAIVQRRSLMLSWAIAHNTSSMMWIAIIGNGNGWNSYFIDLTDRLMNWDRDRGLGLVGEEQNVALPMANKSVSFEFCFECISNHYSSMGESNESTDTKPIIGIGGYALSSYLLVVEKHFVHFSEWNISSITYSRIIRQWFFIRF